MLRLTVSERSCKRPRSVASGPSVIIAGLREHEALLRATARKLCGNAADADDLLHDCYERALRGWERYDERGNLKSWLMTILHNQFIDRCRKARRRLDTDTLENAEPVAPEPVAMPAWADVTSEQVEGALAQLSEEFRTVYKLHVDGHSYEAIASQLAIPKATVGTRLVRARKKLKDILQRQLDGGQRAAIGDMK